MSNTDADPIDLGIMINQGTTLILTRQLLDHTLTPIPAADLASVTLTLYEQVSQAIINDRDHVSVLNANNGTVSATGVLALEFSPNDNVRKTTAAAEIHVALIEWTYAAGARRGKGELLWRVRRVRKAA